MPLAFQYILQLLMHLLRIMHGVIFWRQKHLPFAVANQYVIMVATGPVSNAVVDVQYAHLIVRYRLFVRTAQFQCDPRLVLFAVHLLFNREESFDAIAQNAWLVSPYLHLATHNHHRLLGP